MRHYKSFLSAILVFFSVCLMTGCGDYVGKEKSHPLFVKAGSCRVAGNYKEAAQYFEEFLYICPKSALAHYELASVYGDNLEDPFRAMYHYGKYIELSPESDDKEDVKKFAESCRKRLFEQLSKEYESLETEKAYGEAAKLKVALQKYIEYAGKLKAQNDQMRKIISERKFVREVSVRPLRTAAPAAAPGANDPFAQGSVTVKTQTPGTQPAAASQARVYTVVSGDTLSKISKKMYGTTIHYPKIEKANEELLKKRRNMLFPGMKLTIPPLGGSR